MGQRGVNPKNKVSRRGLEARKSHALRQVAAALKQVEKRDLSWLKEFDNAN